MAILKADKTTTMNGVTVNEYLLTKHNPNHIAMPSEPMQGGCEATGSAAQTAEGKIIGVTIHNTDDIKTATGTTPAEQYTRATVNGNMKDVRVHYYVDEKCAWQNLPHDLSGWHAADGSGNGNRKTIAIECIMSSAYNADDQKAEDNAARLAAALLKQYGLGIDCLFTHTHWLNVRDGVKGDVDTLNTKRNPYKHCPAYILPHWDKFKAKVQAYLADDELYRVRKTWDDAKSQIGAFKSLDNAKKSCASGYSVFDEDGKAVHSNGKSYAKGTKVTLKDVMLYASSTAKTGVKRSGTFYLYDGKVINGRMRITNSPENCGNTPIGKYVTGWIEKKDI